MPFPPSALAAGLASFGRGLASVGRGLASLVPAPRTDQRPVPPAPGRFEREAGEDMEDDWRGLGWGSRDWTELGCWRDIGRARRRGKG